MKVFLILQIIVFLISQIYTVFSLCKILSSFFHKMQFYWFSNYSFYSVTKHSFALFANYNCFLFPAPKYSFAHFTKYSFLVLKNTVLLVSRKQFYLFHKLQFVFFLCPKIVRIPVEDWRLMHQSIPSTNIPPPGRPPGFCTLLLPRGRDLYLMTFAGGQVFAYP